MLSPKPWKLDAIVRLVASVFLCVYGGARLVAVLHQGAIHGKRNLRLYIFAGAAFACLGMSLVLLWKQWRLESAMRQMTILLLSFYAGVFLGAWALRSAAPATPSVSQMIVAALSFQGAALVLVGRFLREHQMGWREAFGFGNQWPQALMLGIIVACLFLPLGWGLQWLSAK